MRYLLLGLLYDRDKETEIFARLGYAQAQVNQYQWGFVDGINESLGVHLDIIASIPTGSYPKKSKKLFVKKDLIESSYGVDYVGFVNFYSLREITRTGGVYKKLEQYIAASNDYVTVFVYSLYYPFMKILKRMKEIYGAKVHVVLIVPDLVGENTFKSRSTLKNFFRNIHASRQMSYAAYADSYVFLTEEMKNLFPQKPYNVIEGFLPSCRFDYTQKRIPKTILYTGSLNSAFGINTLLEAFSRIPDEEYRLWICGAGDREADVRRAAQRDKRIEFMGFLPKSEISRLQTQCDVLINPRPAQGEFTKYSFPSKTMEYLLSGSKVVMYRLPGVPDEYYNYIRTIEAPTAEAIQTAVCRACEDTEFYDARWQEQVQWIQENKNARAQAERMLHLSNSMELGS